MDALTWFKSVFQRALTTPASLRADMATEAWADVPLHLAAARLRPRVAAADDDEDWNAMIARAKVQAASSRAPSPPPPPLPRQAVPETQITPPPVPARRIPARAPSPAPPPLPRRATPESQVTPPPVPTRRAPSPLMAKLRAPRANPDLVAWGELKKLAASRPAPAAHRAAEADLVTPPPVAKARPAAASLFRPAKRH